MTFRPPSIFELPPGPHLDKIYLPIPSASHRLAIALGAQREEDSVYVHRAQDLSRFQILLPLCERADRESIQVDLIPETSWGASLANLLTSSSWNELRAPVLERHGRRCEICGERGGELGRLMGSETVDCHELWSYPVPGIQRLERLLSVCRDCHLMFHLGFAETRGLGAEAAGRLATVNGWGELEANIRIERIFDTWRARSVVRWALDVSPVVRPDQVLVLTNGLKAKATLLLGARYRHSRNEVVHGPSDPKPYYSGPSPRAGVLVEEGNRP